MSQTTKRALEASLKKLLLQKPLNKITINDITEDCGVNRMTFYYHFKDIYDLVDWIMVEDAAKALEGRQSFENWTDAFLDILHQVQDNKVLVMNVYRSVSREQVEQYLYKLLDSMLRDFVDRSANSIFIIFYGTVLAPLTTLSLLFRRKKAPKENLGSLKFTVILLYYSMIVATRPEPTVLPPSRIANVRPCSIAIG